MHNQKKSHFVVALLLSALMLGAAVQSAWAGTPPPEGVVNLNTATAAELEVLPGIGPAKADAIIKWRATHNGFKDVQDLRRVKGFGRKTVSKLSPYLRVKGPTTIKSKSTGRASASK